MATPEGWREVSWQRELAAVCDRWVDAVMAQDGINVDLSAPPRHGKSQIVGRSTPVRLLLEANARNEPMALIYVTSTGDRAAEVSWSVRSAVERLHGEYLAAGAPKAAAKWAPSRTWGTTEWVTEGGHSWLSAGWSQKIAGTGARALILDDLTGSAEAYRSAADRAKLKVAIEADILSRKAKGAGVIHMETRRGVDDTTALIRREWSSAWESHVWPCWTPDRGYLWPEDYGDRWRAGMPHLTDSAPVWRSEYQQEPVAAGGTLIAAEWLDATYSEAPGVARALSGRVVLGVDLAATGRTTSDHCAFVVLGCRGAYRDVLHVERARLDYPAQRQRLLELVAEWKPSATVVELAAGGHAIVAELQAVVPGLRGESPKGDKVTRLTPHLPTVQARQLRLPVRAEPWVRAYREELTAFSGTPGEPDDQVDATVWALVASEGSRQPSAADWAAL